MAEENVAANGAAQASQPGVDELAAQVKALTEERDKAVAESRKWEGRSKSNAAAAKRLAELEDASKTDAERLADAQKRAEEAEAKLADYERRAERGRVVAEVAAENGLDAEWLGRMAGDTAEEIQANADFLASKLSGAPIYPSVTDNGQKKAPSKKSAQDQFGDWFATVSSR